MFRLKKLHCNVCNKVIAEGVEKAFSIVKMKPNKVTKKKKEIEEEKKKILTEIQDRV
jgi:hypothetical protein